MILEIGITVKIISLRLASSVFEHVPQRSARDYFRRRKGTVKKTGLLSGPLKKDAGIYYVQLPDGLLAPYHEDELEIVN